MKNFGRKNFFSKITQSKTFLILFFIILVFFFVRMMFFLEKTIEARHNTFLAEERVASLEASKARLSYDIDRLSTEIGVEATIREKFGLVKEGENVIMIVDKDETLVQETAKEKGFWSFFKKWLK